MRPALTLEQYYTPNQMLPFVGAFVFHALLYVWNPTLMTAGKMTPITPLMQVEFKDTIPLVEPPKPEPPKKVEKKKVPPPPKAKKAGISMTKKPLPIPVMKRQPPPPPKLTPKPFVSRVAMPKFVPRSSDEPIAASPAPGISAPARQRAVNAFKAPEPLKAKSRGIRAADINFELTDRGAISAVHTVAIPIGEERGDIASLPSAPMIHDAPKGRKAVPGYRFSPGEGAASELSDKGAKGLVGYHGMVKAETYTEGGITGSKGKGPSRIGQGFELGGPVGDRKILHRKLPEYPDWAEEKGIVAVVRLYFTVKPDGSIRSNVRVDRSSGYTELDQIAKEALMQWRFSATDANSSADEAWGIITFRFTLA
jgi:TonB family protein